MAEQTQFQAQPRPSNLKTLGAWLALGAVLTIVLLLAVGGAWAMSQYAAPK